MPISRRPLDLALRTCCGNLGSSWPGMRIRIPTVEAALHAGAPVPSQDSSRSLRACPRRRRRRQRPLSGDGVVLPVLGIGTGPPGAPHARLPPAAPPPGGEAPAAGKPPSRGTKPAVVGHYVPSGAGKRLGRLHVAACKPSSPTGWQPPLHPGKPAGTRPAPPRPWQRPWQRGHGTPPVPWAAAMQGPCRHPLAPQARGGHGPPRHGIHMLEGAWNARGGATVARQVRKVVAAASEISTQQHSRTASPPHSNTQGTHAHAPAPASAPRACMAKPGRSPSADRPPAPPPPPPAALLPALGRLLWALPPPPSCRCTLTTSRATPARSASRLRSGAEEQHARTHRLTAARGASRSRCWCSRCFACGRVCVRVLGVRPERGGQADNRFAPYVLHVARQRDMPATSEGGRAH